MGKKHLWRSSALSKVPTWPPLTSLTINSVTITFQRLWPHAEQLHCRTSIRGKINFSMLLLMAGFKVGLTLHLIIGCLCFGNTSFLKWINLALILTKIVFTDLPIYWKKHCSFAISVMLSVIYSKLQQKMIDFPIPKTLGQQLSKLRPLPTAACGHQNFSLITPTLLRSSESSKNITATYLLRSTRNRIKIILSITTILVTIFWHFLII